jgi:hypothetical protein
MIGKDYQMRILGDSVVHNEELRNFDSGKSVVQGLEYNAEI